MQDAGNVMRAPCEGKVVDNSPPPQAGQMTVPQFNDFVVAWTYSLKPFRV